MVRGPTEYGVVALTDDSIEDGQSQQHDNQLEQARHQSNSQEEQSAQRSVAKQQQERANGA